MGRILLVEDNPDEVSLAHVALARTNRQLEVVVAMDGLRALEWLKAASLPPDVMLLDINMPVLDGFGVLEALAANPRWRDIPVVVLTTSSRPADLERARSLGARAVHTKPAEFPNFAAKIAAIVDQYVPSRRD